MLPESLDPDTLRTVAIGALAITVLLALVVVRLVQKAVLRVILLGALGGIGLYVWSQRAELDDCRRTCDCAVAGFDVQVPGCDEVNAVLTG